MNAQIVQKVHMKWVITYEACSFFSFIIGHLSLRQDAKCKIIVDFSILGLFGFS